MHAALTASTICLETDWRPAHLLRRSGDPAAQWALSDLIESAKSLGRPANRITLDIQAAHRAVDHCRLGNERAYRLLSNIYDFASIPPPRSTQPLQSSLLDALDAAEAEFNERPFAIPVPTNSRFLTFNQSRHAAEQYATTMEVVGSRFVEKCLPSHPVEVTELGDVQHSVFKHVSEDLVGVVKDQVNSLPLGLERSLFEEEMHQLEMALKSARTSRESAKFSIAFFGMVKAGKSLFLNALIGRSILPSDGILFFTSLSCHV